eukprot:sb/3470454/
MKEQGVFFKHGIKYRVLIRSHFTCNETHVLEYLTVDTETFIVLFLNKVIQLYLGRSTCFMASLTENQSSGDDFSFSPYLRIRKRPNIRFGSVRFGGSVFFRRFGSVRFGGSVFFRRFGSVRFGGSVFFRRFGSVRFGGSVFFRRFGSVRFGGSVFFRRFGSVRFGGKNPVSGHLSSQLITVSFWHNYSCIYRYNMPVVAAYYLL